MDNKALSFQGEQPADTCREQTDQQSVDKQNVPRLASSLPSTGICETDEADDDDGDDSGMDSSSSNRFLRKRSNSKGSVGGGAPSSNNSAASGASTGTPATASTTLMLTGNSHHSANSQSSATTLDHSLYTTMSENDNSEVSVGSGFGASKGNHHGNYHHLPDLHHEPIIEVPAEEPLDTNSHYAVLNFVMEDRIFLKAALDLLAERDRTAPELGMYSDIRRF